MSKFNLVKFFVCFLLAAFLPVLCFSQSAKPEKKLVYWGSLDAYFKTQSSVMLDLINEALIANPPSTTFSMSRKLALYNLDAILHDTRNDKSEALHDYICTRMDAVIKDLSLPLQTGMKIYKIYNDGFVIRTKSTVLAFDLCGKCGSIVPDSLMQKIVDKCEVLFISHIHDDHADMNVSNMFLKAGKLVYAPAKFREDNTEIQHLYSDKVIDKTIKLRGGTIKVKVFPGHQDDLQNNDHVVTLPEGFTVVHLGDQYNQEDMVWMKDIYKQIPRVDALMVDSWIAKMDEVIADFNPKLVITAHENEMGHSIDHREAFWLTYYKMEKITKPYLIMSWGEWYNYKSRSKRRF
jgi:L-ascorbate metabolism protein UlaG (beta-lactamase superfamily)